MAAAGPGVQEPGDICTPGSSRGQVGQLAPGLTSSCETVVTLGDTGERCECRLLVSVQCTAVQPQVQTCEQCLIILCFEDGAQYLEEVPTYGFSCIV